MEEHEKISKSINDNLRFIITISIFFLTIFSESRLQGSIIIVGYIICYIAFALRKNRLTVRNLKWVQFSLFSGLFSYIFPLSIMVLATTNSELSRLAVFTWKTLLLSSLYLIVCMPMISLVMILFLSNMTWIKYKEESHQIFIGIKQKLFKNKALNKNQDI